MKVVLTAVNAKYIHSNLAVRYLREFTKELDYEAVTKEYSINDRIERIVEDIMREKPDLVAFSCYIWNMEYIVKISTIIKTIDRSIEILYGGPEVSYDSEEYLKNQFVDYVIEGEGEQTFYEFIQFKLGNKDVENIRGIYYKQNINNMAGGNEVNGYKIKYNSSRTLMNLNEVSFPYTEEELIENKIVYYEASRGCPFNCKYCLSSTIHGVRFQEIDRVKKELQYIMDKGVRLVKFVDRTFNCKSDFAMAIWKFLIEADTNATFHFEISADILKQEEIELLKSAPKGRIQFEVGVQSTNPEVLENINRKIKFEDIKIKVKQLKKLKNIKQHLDLIAGLPGEDFMTFKKSFNDVYSIEPEAIQLGFLKLLKGSSMREESVKWGIRYSPYPPYEVLSTNHISYEELIILKQVEEMVDKYYNSGKFHSIINYFLPQFGTPFDFYNALGKFFYNKGYFKKNISGVDYYRVFIEFNNEILKQDDKALKEIIKYDYLRFNKRKWLPDFLLRDYNRENDNYFKAQLKDVYKDININKIHIEKFNLNINEFLNSNTFIYEPVYYLFEDGKSKVSELKKNFSTN
jgi:radical SAM superfamily enzyme YgiQ (UPF0313 family)